MAFVICPPCIKLDHAVCEKACVEVCPVQCIYPPEKTLLPQELQQDMLYIHPYECVHCGACVPVCPVEAIFAEDEVPKKWKKYIAIHISAFEAADLSTSRACPYGMSCPYPRWKRVEPKKKKLEQDGKVRSRKPCEQS